jgi:hypothetical protein
VVRAGEDLDLTRVFVKCAISLSVLSSGITRPSTLDRKEGTMNQHLDELKRACKAAVKRSDSQRIDQGESTWFFGRPAPADAGFIAISQDEYIRTIIREEDVQEVSKEGDIYFVKVSTDANVLVRYESVTKAKPVECGCGGSDEKEFGQTGAIAQQGPWGPTGPFGEPIFGYCRLHIRCIWWGARQICYWWIFCPSRTGRI